MTTMKSYFGAPNFDCRLDGPIVLGSILSDPLDPEEPLNDTPVPIPKHDIQINVQTNYETVWKQNREGGGGIFAKFLETMGFELSGSNSHNAESFAKFAELQTSTFNPSMDYMEESLAASKVQKYLLNHRLPKGVFMVTGIKVAFGATVRETVRQGGQFTVTAGYDGPVGLPINIGPRVNVSRGSELVTSFAGSNPFVFAYRLRKIRYRKGNILDKPYRDGALYSVEGRQDVETCADKEGPVEVVVFLRLDEEDLTAKDVGLESAEVKEDGGVGDEDFAIDGNYNGNTDKLCEFIIRPKDGKVLEGQGRA